MKQAFKEAFVETIETYSEIAVYRHQAADGDALGSQWGLVCWLRKHYPHKNIYALGSNDFNFPEDIFKPMDETLPQKPFLAIIVDTANSDRIDGSNYAEADTMVKIDHHPIVEDYASLSYVDPAKGSCSEIIADLLYDLSKDKLGAKIAQSLMAGILTDTKRFSIETTTSDTLRVAARLMDEGVDISYLNGRLFNRHYDVFKLRNHISEHVVYDQGVAYFILSQEALVELGLKPREAKQYVSLMDGIQEFGIWAAFVEDEGHAYMGSVRSREKTINTICEQYNGGGHRLACGVNHLTLTQVHELIGALKAQLLTA